MIAACVAPGFKADINVIDFDRLMVHAPEVLYDLPSGGRRLVQRTEGYEATIVSGVPVYRNGEATNELPGRLVRGAKAKRAMPYGGRIVKRKAVTIKREGWAPGQAWVGQQEDGSPCL